MTTLEILVFLPILFIYILYLIMFSKLNLNGNIKDILEESRLHDLDSFIESKKYEYDKWDSIMQTTLGALIAMFIGFKVVGIVQLFVYILLSYVFVLAFLVYWGLGKFHARVIKNLYLNSTDISDKNFKIRKIN